MVTKCDLITIYDMTAIGDDLSRKHNNDNTRCQFLVILRERPPRHIDRYRHGVVIDEQQIHCLKIFAHCAINGFPNLTPTFHTK